MAKPFYRLQRFLRQTQLLFLFLGVAYIMAGSVLLLQRHGLVVSQRGTSSYFPSPSLPSPPRSLEAPALRTVYGIMGNRLTVKGMGYQGGLLADNAGPHWLISRNQEIRHLRRRWFHSLMSEQEMSRVEKVTPKRKIRHKGTYIGCFLDDAKDRALKGMVFYDFRKMTSTLCQDTCTERLAVGTFLAGLPWRCQCHVSSRGSWKQFAEELRLIPVEPYTNTSE